MPSLKSTKRRCRLHFLAGWQLTTNFRGNSEIEEFLIYEISQRGILGTRKKASNRFCASGEWSFLGSLTLSFVTKYGIIHCKTKPVQSLHSRGMVEFFSMHNNFTFAQLEKLYNFLNKKNVWEKVSWWMEWQLEWQHQSLSFLWSVMWCLKSQRKICLLSVHLWNFKQENKNILHRVIRHSRVNFSEPGEGAW